MEYVVLDFKINYTTTVIKIVGIGIKIDIYFNAIE